MRWRSKAPMMLLLMLLLLLRRTLALFWLALALALAAWRLLLFLIFLLHLRIINSISDQLRDLVESFLQLLYGAIVAQLLNGTPPLPQSETENSARLALIIILHTGSPAFPISANWRVDVYRRESLPQIGRSSGRSSSHREQANDGSDGSASRQTVEDDGTGSRLTVESAQEP